MLPRSETVLPVSRLSFESWPDSEMLYVTNGLSSRPHNSLASRGREVVGKRQKYLGAERLEKRPVALA